MPSSEEFKILNNLNNNTNNNTNINNNNKLYLTTESLSLEIGLLKSHAH